MKKYMHILVSLCDVIVNRTHSNQPNTETHFPNVCFGDLLHYISSILRVVLKQKHIGGKFVTREGQFDALATYCFI